MSERGRFHRALSFLSRISEVKFAINIFIAASGLLLIPAFAHAQKSIVAWSAVSALNSPFWVMNDAGFWKQEGLDIQLVYIANAYTVVSAKPNI